MVNFDPLFFDDAASPKAAATKALDQAWTKLSEGGMALMPLDQYPFSERYGWIQDKYGVTWQLILTNPAGDPRPPIIPSLMFVGDNVGKAEDAINFYCSVFRDSKIGSIMPYGPNQEPDQAGTVMFADFMLENQWFAAMDSAHEQQLRL
jgi:predicted 3-demethylubiquinone-9 3-methyltransferase (glyoxalase superfamily)